MNLGLQRNVKVELSSQQRRLIFNKLRERIELHQQHQQKTTMAQNFKWFVLQKTNEM
jgi:hypothetical protein